LFAKLLACVLLVAVSVPVATLPLLTQPAQTVTSTLTSSIIITTLSTSSNAFSSSVIVTAVPKGSTNCGHFKYYVFNASAGPIAGTITSNDTQLNFEVASISDFNAWALQPDGSYVGRDCVGPQHPIVTHDAVTSYSFSANLPNSGEYVLTFINTPGDQTAYVTVSMNYQAVYKVTTMSYAFQTQTGPGGNLLANIPGFPFESVLLGLVLALVILVVKRSRNARHTRTNTAEHADNSHTALLGPS